MPSNLPYKQAANVERRTWDKETYEAIAKARIAAENSSDAHKGSDQKQTTDHESRSVEKEEFQNADSGARGPMNSKRAFLKARRGKGDLESKLGTSEIINPDDVSYTHLTLPKNRESEYQYLALHSHPTRTSKLRLPRY